MRVVRTDQPAEWDRLVGRTQHDVYHLASYHRLAEERGEGDARLVALENDACSFVLPILLRRVAEVPGLEDSPLTDVTSTYGYVGPLVDPESPNPESRARLAQALQRYFDEINACCIFARLHPLLEQAEVLNGLGAITDVGPTVAIDLTAAEDEQWANIRHDHKNGINRLRRAGFQCLWDVDLRHLDEFMKLYGQTMRRVGAGDYYLFSPEYFKRLFALESVAVSLFVCLRDGVVACGGVFTLCDGIVQYHLSGTRQEYLRLAPTKLMLDEVRKWAVARGARVFHLGGGVGSRSDSLFQFKAGFSRRYEAFRVWTWIREETEYFKLVSNRDAFLSRRGQRRVDASYFPAYRAPSEDCESSPGS
jgi:hypothetical protein